MNNKKKIKCDKCGREISSNNFQRHYDACIGPPQPKKPRQAWNKGLPAWNKGKKTGPKMNLREVYAEIRKERDTKDIKSHSAIRRKILEEQNNKCNRCGISEWMGQPISLELEHKDGVRTNNERSNLECLCPNCHSLTHTWRGKNRTRYNHDDPAREGAELIIQ